MRIVIAPDSFKGSLDAAQVARAIAEGVCLASEHSYSEIPMADGGEGTLEIIARNWGVIPTTVQTVDAIGRPTHASYALDAEKTTAVIEVAQASGLPGVSDVILQPMKANTYGTGIVIRDALDAGATSIILCLGGSATTDGGIGILGALGARLLDSSGLELAPIPSNLALIASIDSDGIHPGAAKALWVLTVDVTNPLTGSAGSASVFGPQKGATPAQVLELDAGLSSFAKVLNAHSGIAIEQAAGAGAAGGIPAAIMALFPYRLVPGSDLLAEMVGLDAAIATADLVITGEGRCDSQSARGKVVSRVASSAASASQRPPVVVIAGQVVCDSESLQAMGVSAAFSIANGPQTLIELFDTTASAIRDLTVNVITLSQTLRAAAHKFGS